MQNQNVSVSVIDSLDREGSQKWMPLGTRGFGFSFGFTVFCLVILPPSLPFCMGLKGVGEPFLQQGWVPVSVHKHRNRSPYPGVCISDFLLL